jgi:hypothetical protein
MLRSRLESNYLPGPLEHANKGSHVGFNHVRYVRTDYLGPILLFIAVQFGHVAIVIVLVFLDELITPPNRIGFH